MFAHPFVILPRSVLLNWNDPGCAFPTAIVVFAAIPFRLIVPVPVNAALICASPAEERVRVLVPIFWAPAIEMIPLLDLNSRSSFHVLAPTVMVPVASVRPKTMLDHPLVILPKSAAFKDNVPGCPVPTPIVVAAVAP